MAAIIVALPGKVRAKAVGVFCTLRRLLGTAADWCQYVRFAFHMVAAVLASLVNYRAQTSGQIERDWRLRGKEVPWYPEQKRGFLSGSLSAARPHASFPDARLSRREQLATPPHMTSPGKPKEVAVRPLPSRPLAICFPL
eukprot:scaffold14500_cov73-Phaeocystis_antarctica.AAC.1